MSRFSKKCDNSTLTRRYKIVVENAATTEIRLAGMPMMYSEKKGRLEIDFMVDLDANVTAVGGKVRQQYQVQIIGVAHVR